MASSKRGYRHPTSSSRWPSQSPPTSGTAAVQSGQAERVIQAALDVGHASLDLQMQYRERNPVDRAPLAVWRGQLVFDRERGDRAGVAGDRAVMTAIRARING